MQIGTLIHAPNGFHTLEKGIDYFFLRSNRAVGRVLLVIYSPPPRNTADLVAIERKVFEAGLLEKSIVPLPGSGLPPHLAHFSGFNFDVIDTLRRNAQRSHRDRVEERLFKIAPLLERETEILGAADPIKLINKVALANGHNAQRLRTWFLTYLLFGRNLWSLLPNYHAAGYWDRYDEEKMKDRKKRGRRSTLRGHGASTPLTKSDIQLILDSYLKRCKLGRPLTTIYEEAMITDFAAKVTTDSSGIRRLVSSGKATIPTYDQYRYHLRKTYGLDSIQRTKYGEARYRRRYAEHVGTFASRSKNLYERVEADVYHTDDRPAGYIDGEELPTLSVARAVDTVSGMRIGIGFALGAEHSSAYNAMQFCAAISKQKFCALFGIEIKEEDWPSQGLPLQYVTDRGPGVKRAPGETSTDVLQAPVMRELAVAGSGQSKAFVESAQRRRTNLEGPHTKPLSDLSPYRMAQREIRRLLAENLSSNVKSRLTPDMDRAGVLGTPMGVWKFLDARARNDAQPLPFADAVRRFLDPITVRVTRNGIHLFHQRFDSQSLRETGLLSRIGLSGTQELQAYILPLSMRYAWVEVDGMLVEAEAQLPINDDRDQLDRSYIELEEEHRLRKENEIIRRHHARAVNAQQLADFEEDSPGKWHPSRRRSAHQPVATRTSPDLIEAKALVKGGADV